MSDASARLLDALKANDDSAVHEILQLHPDAAGERGPEGESLVLSAVYRGKSDLARLLASGSETDLCEATALGDTTRMAFLLDRGASLDVRSFDGWTPLHLAAFFGQVEAARLLLDRGAEVDAVSRNSSANTPLCAALAGQGNEEIVRLLLDAGADVNARASRDVTPLHLAASRGANALIEVFLALGAKADATMDDGTTPESMAAARGHPGAAALLQAATRP